MASCVLTIDSVLGGPSRPLSPEYCLTYVTVTGTVTDGPGGACPAVSVTVHCHNGDFEVTGGVTAWGQLDGPHTVSGYLVQGQWQIVLETYCCCDRDMVVTASCPVIGCSDDVSAPLQCASQCCPVVVGKAKTGPCDSTGHANVDFTVLTRILDNCAPGSAKLDWGDGSPYGQAHALPVGQGGFLDSHVYAPGQYIARVITGSPENCPLIGIAVRVDCPPPNDCCPEMETVAQCGPCNPHGISEVVLTTAVLIGDDCPPATVRIEHEDGSSASHTFAATGQFSWPAHPYPAGQHSVTVDVTSPKDCPGTNLSFNVPCPPPPCCPQISASAKVGPCGSDGQAPVTFTASVQPAADPACPAVSWRYDFGDGALQPARGPGTFNDVRPYPAGPHSATIKLLSPPGCGELPVSFNVNCPDCCPDVSIVPCIPDCGDDADREVKFKITVAPKGPPCPAKAIAFRMDFGDGSAPGTSYSIPAGGAPLSFNETHTYSGQHALQDVDAALNVSQPPECARSYAATTIPACCTKQRAKKCKALFLVMSWDLTLALLFFLFWILGGITLGCSQCAPFNAPAAVHKYVFYAFAIAGLFLLAAYLIFCTKCSCGWLNRLLWRILFGAGLLYAIYAGCALSWLSLIIGLLMIWLAFVFLNKWRSKCCVSECKYLKEIFVWGVLQVYGLTALLTTTHIAVGCLFVLFTLPLVGPVTVFGVATMVLFIAFSAYFVNKCVL
jgi:hypothetical protein